MNCGYEIKWRMILAVLISCPQFTYDLFHMHHSPSYLSREHMNPQLTCSQRQWLHSSVGRASHRYREVTGSSPVEVLNFFRLLYAIAKIAIVTARIILHLILSLENGRKLKSCQRRGRTDHANIYSFVQIRTRNESFLFQAFLRFF